MASSTEVPPTGGNEATGDTPHQALAVDDNSTGDNTTDDNSDLDSTYGSNGSDYTTSLASSVYNYKYENGRRYHAYREGSYVLPNDEIEQQRLDLQHHMWRLLLGGSLYTAPLSEPMRILDLGTGTGIWAIEIADEFDSAEVYGIDLSPIQPSWVPPNCRFHVDDYDGEWTYTKDQAFDFIHGRALSGTSADWSKFYRQIFENLKPGGFVEMQEYDAWVFSDDDSFDRAPWCKEWVQKIDEASKGFNKQINVAQYQKQWMIDAGFKDVKEEVHRIPIGPWAKDKHLKELGKFERVHMQMSVESHTPALFTRVLGYSEDQTNELMEEVKAEFRKPELHLYTIYRFISGRRPM